MLTGKNVIARVCFCKYNYNIGSCINMINNASYYLTKYNTILFVKNLTKIN